MANRVSLMSLLITKSYPHAFVSTEMFYTSPAVIMMGNLRCLFTAVK